MNYKKYAELYKNALLNDVVPFWLKHSGDQQSGGYFTCLDRQGNVFDTDKFMWLQGRQVWTFAMLYNSVEQNQDWLNFALLGERFMTRHGRDSAGNWYFSCNREGRPLVEPYNIFSDCFAAMAYARLFEATGAPEHARIASETFLNILKRQQNPEGRYSYIYPGTRDLQGFTLPMILSNLSMELRPLLEPALFEQVSADAIEAVMNRFYRPQYGVTLEYINADGSFSDSFEGRLVNPGHGLEAMWFIMDQAVRKNDMALLKKAEDIALKLLAFGWDDQYGGIFYFLDIKGFPPQQLEWDQKLWWVHIETMITMLKGFLHTGNIACWEWFEKIHLYCLNHFTDKEHGEWFGYLNRRGEVLLNLKGGKWKGCFHVPRGLYQIWKTLEQIASKYETGSDRLP